MKHNNSHMMGIPEGEENEQGIENLFEEIMTQIFPNLGRKKTQVWEAQTPQLDGPHQGTSQLK